MFPTDIKEKLFVAPRILKNVVLGDGSLYENEEEYREGFNEKLIVTTFIKPYFGDKEDYILYRIPGMCVVLTEHEVNLTLLEYIKETEERYKKETKEEQKLAFGKMFLEDEKEAFDFYQEMFC